MQKIIAEFTDEIAATYTTRIFFLLADDPEVESIYNADTGELLHSYDFELMDSMGNLDGSATAYLFRSGKSYHAAIIGDDRADGDHFGTYEAMTRFLYRDGFRFF